MSYRDEIRASLLDLLCDSVGADLVVSRQELRDSGVPARHHGSLVRESKALTDVRAAVLAADAWAGKLDAERSAHDLASPEDLARMVPRTQ